MSYSLTLNEAKECKCFACINFSLFLAPDHFLLLFHRWHANWMCIFHYLVKSQKLWKIMNIFDIFSNVIKFYHERCWGHEVNIDCTFNLCTLFDSIQPTINLYHILPYKSSNCSGWRQRCGLCLLKFLTRNGMKSSIFSKIIDSAKMWRFFSALDLIVHELNWFLVFCTFITVTQITYFAHVNAKTESRCMCIFINVHFPKMSVVENSKIVLKICRFSFTFMLSQWKSRG